METKKTNMDQQGIYKVVDTQKCLILVAIAGVSLYFGTDPDILGIWGYVIGALVGLKAKAEWGGCIIDMDEKTLEFAGGGITPNEFSDYLKLSFWLQTFKRFKVDIEEIQSIEAFDKSRMDNKGHVTHKYYMKFVGTFGTAKIKFTSEGKRDQLYAAIREINQMGIPVV